VVEGPPVERGGAPIDSGWGVRVVRCAEANVSRARNIGLHAAAGEVVAFLDDDAVPQPTWLAELLAPYQDQRVAGSGGIVLDGNGFWPWWGYAMCDRLGRVSFTSDAPDEACLRPGADPFAYLAGGNMSFRREHLLEVDGFDEELAYLYEDPDVCMRLIDAGAVLRPLQSAPVYHRSLPSAVRGTSRVPSDPLLPMRSLTYFALRHGRRYPPGQVDAAIEERARALRSAADGARRIGELDARAHARFLARLSEGEAAGRQGATKDGGQRARPPDRESPSFGPFRLTRKPRGALRICVLAPLSSDGGGGGIGRVADETTRALAARGHEPHVISLSEREAGVELMAGVWHHKLRSVDLRHPSLRTSPIAAELYAAATKYHAVRKLHERATVDLVVATTWLGEGLLCVLDPRLTTATRLVTPVGRIAEMHAADGAQDRPTSLGRLERAVLERSRHIQSASEAIFLEIESALGLTLPPAHITPLGTGDRAGVSPERFAAAGEVEVLFVGRLEPRKGTDVLLAAARDLVREHPDTVFAIVGADNPHAAGFGERMRAYVSEDAALSQRVRFLGAVPDERLWRIYAGADIVCAPSRYESYCNVLVEALMSGKPAVACLAGGMPEVVEHDRNGLLAAPGDVESLRTCLSRLIADRALRDRFGRRSRELYELKHSPARIAERTGRAFREMADAGVRRRAAEARDGEGRSDTDADAMLEFDLARAIAQICELDAHGANEVAHALCEERLQPVAYISEAVADWRKSDLEFLQTIYRAVLSRELDADGRGRWAEHLQAGGSRFDVLNEVAASAEARAHSVPEHLGAEVLECHRRAIYKRAMEAWTLADDGFLACLHLAVLGRAAAKEWITANLGSLEAGHSRSSVAQQLAESPEARSYAMPTDWVP